MSSALKNRLKNYSFWVSLASAILLLVQAIGKPLGLVINEEIYMSIVNSVLGVFVVLGIISHPAQNLISSSSSTNVDTVNEKETEASDSLKSVEINNDNKSNSANCENVVNVVENNDVKSLAQIKQQILNDCAQKDNVSNLK